VSPCVVVGIRWSWRGRVDVDSALINLHSSRETHCGSLRPAGMSRGSERISNGKMEREGREREEKR